MRVGAPAVRASLDYAIDATRSPLSHSLSISTPVERLSERLLAPQRATAMAGLPAFPWRGRTAQLKCSTAPAQTEEWGRAEIPQRGAVRRHIHSRSQGLSVPFTPAAPRHQ